VVTTDSQIKFTTFAIVDDLWLSPEFKTKFHREVPLLGR